MNDLILLALVPVAAYAAVGGLVRRATGKSEKPIDPYIVLGGCWTFAYTILELTGTQLGGMSSLQSQSIWIYGFLAISLLRLWALRRGNRTR
jgi:hypothetical protein